jgi:hypothetical protein
MDPDLTNFGQRHRPRMSFPTTDQVPARLSSVAEAETVAAAAFALAPGKTDLAAGAGALLGAPGARKRTTEIDCRLLEHLRGDVVSPGKSSRPLGDGAVSGNDERPAGISLCFHALKALMRSYPDHGTRTKGSIRLAVIEAVTNSRHWL